jgi:hypothetical protein
MHWKPQRSNSSNRYCHQSTTQERYHVESGAAALECPFALLGVPTLREKFETNERQASLPETCSKVASPLPAHPPKPARPALRAKALLVRPHVFAGLVEGDLYPAVFGHARRDHDVGCADWDCTAR